MTDPGRRDFLKQATMALVAMGLPVDAIQMSEPHVSSYPSLDLTTLDLISKGDHQIVYRVSNNSMGHR